MGTAQLESFVACSSTLLYRRRPFAYLLTAFILSTTLICTFYFNFGSSTDIEPSSSLISDIPPPVKYTPLPELTPQFAYLFYATNYDYACSVLVNIDRLLHHPVVKTKDARIGVYLSDGMRESDKLLILQAFKQLELETHGRVFTILATPPNNLKKPLDHYKHVLLKLVPYDIATRNSSSLSVLYDPAAHGKTDEIKRIIILDADQLIMRNLDHLFHLPPVEIAAPRMYWGSNIEAPMGVTSTLMVVQPSISLWERMSAAISDVREGEYDMDLLNRVFGREIMTLPGRYCTLNSHWEVNDQPAWYHHDSPAHPDHEQEEGDDAGSGELKMMKTNYTQLSKGDPSSWKEDKCVGLLKDTEVVHFTALGKPWTWNTTKVQEEKPQAHWIFAEMFGEWRSVAHKVCPWFEETSQRHIGVKKRGEVIAKEEHEAEV